MAAESKAEKARRLDREGGQKQSKKLPALWKTFIWINLGALVGSKLLYSLSWFKVRMADNCVADPSDLDIVMTDVSTVSALMLTALLITGLHHLENAQ
jgi:hypothetical protein